MWLTVKLFVFLCFCASFLSESRRIISVTRKNFKEKSGHKNPVSSPRLRNSTNSEISGNNVFEIRKISQPHAIDNVGSERHIPGHNPHSNHQKNAKPKTKAQKIAWHHCADESKPKPVGRSGSGKGVMCSREYPTFTCCRNHDLTVDLLGSKIAEQVPNARCAQLLKKLRCAHCSPRSWWLFHAPDQRRFPHKRVVPILCPKFCRKFHAACRDSIAGLQHNNFCEYHTTNDNGPCFPDYKLKHGTVD